MTPFPINMIMCIALGIEYVAFTLEVRKNPLHERRGHLPFPNSHLYTIQQTNTNPLNMPKKDI